MEYEGMTAEVVARGIIRGSRGSITGVTSSGNGSGAGAGFGAVFFFLGFLDPMAAAAIAPQQQQSKSAKRAHCHNCIAEPEEPDAADPELAPEFMESPDDSRLKELEYDESKDATSALDDSDESHGVKVVVTVVAACTCL